MQTKDILKDSLHGSCACKKAQFSLKKNPIVTHCCHCYFCQRMSGSAFGLNAMIEADQVHLNDQSVLEPIQTPSTHPKGQVWYRCTHCKVAIWSEHPELGASIRIVNVGTLNKPDLISPDVHCWTQSKHPWVVIPEDLPSYLQDYDSDVVWTEEAKNRLQAALQNKL